MMGCGTFRTMSRGAETYVIESVRRTLADRDVAPDQVDHLVLATTDACVGRVPRDFVARVLEGAGLVSCTPVAVSFPQCCSSVTALSYATRMFADAKVRNVVVAAFDFTADDSDRVRSFALFGDGVTTCLLSRDDSGLRLVSSAVRTDYDGLLGRDSMTSRQVVAREAVGTVLATAGVGLGDVTMVFPTNLYTPLTLFNSAVVRIHKSKLHFADTLFAFGHCGNCDWMLNLVDYRDKVGIERGDANLVQASAPGFFACCLLTTT
jgi:3-oxoacyl-[acyl-carrier-protein] synthase-3